MAGYVVSIGSNTSEEELYRLMSNGVYGTILKIKSTWSQQNEGTIADYLSMKPGDHIYFFQKRKLYGIGELVKIDNHDCKLLNYKDADIPGKKSIKNKNLILENDSIRFICTFKPGPFLFKEGLDMDYVLQSNPDAFKMLRVFWKLSFIKIDDIEDKALFDIILRENERFFLNGNSMVKLNTVLHKKIRGLSKADFCINMNNIIQESRKNDLFKREMGLEAAVIERLSNSDDLGKWDYLSHQVVASPFKPVDYMDKMDIFGYRYIPGFNTISKYLVTELKKDTIGKEVVNQTMKYVDWINQEYSNGDFDMIEAIIIANEFEEGVVDHCKDFGVRRFTKNKPAVNKVWSNLKLYKYYINEKNEIKFTSIY